nr:hypothetical protein BaRGS_023637 [Batillaria attramentaria]
MIELVKAAAGTYNYLMCPDAGDVLPKAASLGDCQTFSTCLQTFEGIPDMSTMTASSDGSPDGMNLPSSDSLKAIGHFMANTARTGFWCSWLKHNYRCAVDNAQDCGVSGELVTLGNQKLSQLENTCIGAAIVVINLLPILTAVAVVLNIIL